MYGVYGDIINAAERALESFAETEELLEYPEVQADKAYYLSVLSKYNDLKSIGDRLAALKNALDGESAARALLSDAQSEQDRAAVYEEIATAKLRASASAAAISDALGCKHVDERVYCRIKFGVASARLGAAFSALIRTDLLARGVNIADEAATDGGRGKEISFTAFGADLTARLGSLIGAHKVYVRQSASDELCFAITPAATFEKPAESDFRIDVFRSHGAGGQHINKTETAIRVTHLPTGLTAVCQDERSQLQNKKRAMATIEKRLKERGMQAEKARMEADIRAQYAIKNTPIVFDATDGTFTDARLKAFTKAAFPPDPETFSSYLDGLTVL